MYTLWGYFRGKGLDWGGTREKQDIGRSENCDYSLELKTIHIVNLIISVCKPQRTAFKIFIKFLSYSGKSFKTLQHEEGKTTDEINQTYSTEVNC